MGRGGKEHRRQAVTWRQGALPPMALDRRLVLQRVQLLEIRFVLQRPGEVAAGDGLQGGIGEAYPQTALERRLDVADGLELLAARRCTPACLEALHGTGLHVLLSREHSRTDGLMHALDLQYVDATGGIPDEDGTRHCQLRDRLPAAGGDGAGAGGENF